MEPDERTLARLKAGCICKGVRLIRLIEAIEAGASSFDEVAAACALGDGSCGGKRCRRKVAELLAEPYSE
ncbi:MAG: (2Fe-2S)-binding protein [Desulfobulbus sp.]|jgi:bacterioferritin-associated ferredoxin|nr:(2Fe-2S)-binding protein [Desulfobulbus sp.]